MRIERQQIGSRLRAAAGVMSALAVAVGIVIAAPSAPSASAADTAAFDPGLIITDAVMYDPSTMSEPAIQSFIASKQPACSNYTSAGVTYTCLKNYSGTLVAHAANANCTAVAGAKLQTAGHIISVIAQACGINPQVLLVLLQKEQGLITSAKSPDTYKIATGFGCPDTAPCNSQYYGFSNQVYQAAYSFKQWHQPLSRHYMPGKNNKIQYSPNAACGTATVFIQNLATAALYMYTPYVPNAASLAAGYGLGDGCSTYGNRNFFEYFTDWFGNPGNLVKNASFDKGVAPWRSGSAGSITPLSLTGSTVAQASSRYVSVSAPKAGRRLVQNIARKSSAGQVYSGFVWVKPQDPTATVAGSLNIQTRGGTTEHVSIPFAVTGSDWTKVQAQIALSHSGHSSFDFFVQVDTVSTVLLIDTASFSFAAQQGARASSVAVEESHVGSGTNGGWHYSSSGISFKTHKGGAHAGSAYEYITASHTGRSIYQTVSGSISRNRVYTFGIWLKSSTATPYSGRIQLSAVAGSKVQTATTAFSVGNEWTYRSVTLEITQSGTTRLQLRVDADTVGARLNLDQPTLGRDLVYPGASFESGEVAFTASDASITATSVVPSTPDVTPIDGASVGLVTAPAATVAMVSATNARKLGQNETFTLQLWVKSATPGTPVTGTLTLGAGSTTTPTESDFVDFTADDTWQLITVKHAATGFGLNDLSVRLTLTGPTGGSLYVDALRLS